MGAGNQDTERSGASSVGLENCLAQLSAEASCDHATAGMGESHIAAAAGDVDALSAALSAGASIEEHDGKSGRTPLHSAAAAAQVIALPCSATCGVGSPVMWTPPLRCRSNALRFSWRRMQMWMQRTARDAGGLTQH